MKALEDFPPNLKARDGRGSYCRLCMRLRHRQSRDRQRGGPPSRVYDVAAREERTEKWCAGCKRAKSLAEFGRNRSTRDGLTAYCKPCHNAKGKATYVRLFGSTREYHLRRRYGITGEQYDALVAEQGGVCALCLERPPQHVDHDHLTGAVRGALCSCCNQGLGNFRDSAENLRAAADYLEASTIQRVRVADGVYRLTFPAQPTAQAPVSDLEPLLARRRRA